MTTEDPKAKSARGRETVSEDIEREFAALRADVAALVRLVREYGEVRAGETREKVGRLSEDAVAESLRAAKELRAQLDSIERQIEGNLRQHPISWLVGAMGLGLLFGMLFARRD